MSKAVVALSGGRAMDSSAVRAWYNDNEEFPCQVLEARCADGSLPGGTVDRRDIQQITDAEFAALANFNQWHLFAGIGGIVLGMQLVGWPEHLPILTGGFPCQDISVAGKGLGLAGSRSGLWREMVRAVRMVRPLYVLVENVARLLGRGMPTVLGDLASLGYDAEWDCVSAADAGAPHLRDRVFILAYSAYRIGPAGTERAGR